MTFNQYPINPLIKMVNKHGEIFKVRNSIRSFHDKSVVILYRAVVTTSEFKDSDVKQGCE
jgi:hypothetical protein